MGSGRGQTRRSRSLMRGDPNWTPRTPRQAVTAWKKFVKDQKLENTTISEYYPHPKGRDAALKKW